MNLKSMRFVWTTLSVLCVFSQGWSMDPGPNEEGSLSLSKRKADGLSSPTKYQKKAMEAKNFESTPLCDIKSTVVYDGELWAVRNKNRKFWIIKGGERKEISEAKLAFGIDRFFKRALGAQLSKHRIELYLSTIACWPVLKSALLEEVTIAFKGGFILRGCLHLPQKNLPALEKVGLRCLGVVSFPWTDKDDLSIECSGTWFPYIPADVPTKIMKRKCWPVLEYAGEHRGWRACLQEGDADEGAPIAFFEHPENPWHVPPYRFSQKIDEQYLRTLNGDVRFREEKLHGRRARVETWEDAFAEKGRNYNMLKSGLDEIQDDSLMIQRIFRPFLNIHETLKEVRLSEQMRGLYVVWNCEDGRNLGTFGPVCVKIEKDEAGSQKPNLPPASVVRALLSHIAEEKFKEYILDQIPEFRPL